MADEKRLWEIDSQVRENTRTRAEIIEENVAKTREEISRRLDENEKSRRE